MVNKKMTMPQKENGVKKNKQITHTITPRIYISNVRYLKFGFSLVP
jgi:hypothetical protein